MYRGGEGEGEAAIAEGGGGLDVCIEVEARWRAIVRNSWIIGQLFVVIVG